MIFHDFVMKINNVLSFLDEKVDVFLAFSRRNNRCFLRFLKEIAKIEAALRLRWLCVEKTASAPKAL